MHLFHTTFVEDFSFVDKLGDRDYRNTKGNVTIHYLPTFQHLCKVDKEHKMFHTDLSKIFFIKFTFNLHASYFSKK